MGERLGRAGFYVLFACTVSAQLVDVYLVFAGLIIPALPRENSLQIALRQRMQRRRLAMLRGFYCHSCLTCRQSGLVIVWCMAVVAATVYATRQKVA